MLGLHILSLLQKLDCTDRRSLNFFPNTLTPPPSAHDPSDQRCELWCVHCARNGALRDSGRGAPILACLGLVRLWRLMGCREHALTICDLPRLFRRINVPALPCAGATGAVSDLCCER